MMQTDSVITLARASVAKDGGNPNDDRAVIHFLAGMVAELAAGYSPGYMGRPRALQRQSAVAGARRGDVS